jgi:hypothetical protein
VGVASEKRAPRRLLWAVVGAFVATVLLDVILYGRHGHGFVADDWEWLRNAHFDGPLAAGGWWQLRSRPGAWLSYFLTFGLVGDHPGVLYFILACLNGAVAAALVWTLTPRLGLARAAGIAAVWVLIPNHTALYLWDSTLNVQLAVLFTIIGLHLVAKRDDDRSVWIGVALLTASVLTYEITLGVAGVAIVLLYWRDGWRRITALLAPVVVAAAYSFLSTAHSLQQAALHSKDVLEAEFGTGLGVPDALGKVSIAVLLILAAMSIVRLVRADVRSQMLDDKLVVAGLVVIALGLLPALKSGSNLQALGDRIDAVASIGVAMMLVGIVAPVVRRVPTAAVGVGVLLLIAAFPVANKLSSSANWASDQVKEAAASPTLYVNPEKGSRDQITGAEGSWTVSAARELERGDQNAIACVPPRGPHNTPGDVSKYSLAECKHDAARQPIGTWR